MSLARITIFSCIRHEFDFGLTAALEPLLQGLGDVDGQPLVFQGVADEAGDEVAGRGALALVQLHPLLTRYPCLYDEHAQLGAGEQMVIPDGLSYL